MAKGRTPLQAEKQLALLAEENRKLAAEVEGLQNQGLALAKAARDARAVQATAEQEAKSLKSKLETAEKQTVKLQEANKRLSAQVGRLSRQVEKTPLNPLTVEEASALFDRVIGAFRTSKTLEVKQASLNLKLATAKLGDTLVLLLPDPKAVDPATLHELKVDLTSTARTELVPEAVSPTYPLSGLAAVGREELAATKAPARKRP